MPLNSSIFFLKLLANIAKYSLRSLLCQLTCLDFSYNSFNILLAFIFSFHLHSANRISFVWSFNATMSISLSLCHHLPSFVKKRGIIFFLLRRSRIMFSKINPKYVLKFFLKLYIGCCIE